MPLGTVLQFYF